MPTNTPIAKRIKALRERLGESQEVFGDRFGVQQATVARWENGSVPHRKMWASIAEVAGVPAANFFMDAPVSAEIRPDILREVMIQAFHLQGADLTRAKLLAGLVIEATLTRQAAHNDTASEAEGLAAALQEPRSAVK